jgi:hypothetical protein
MKPQLLFFVFTLLIPAYSQNIPTAINQYYDGEILLDYSPSTGSVVNGWTQGQSMPFPRYYGASIMYDRNDTTWLYVFGGDTTVSGIATRGCLRYNVKTNTWEYIAPLPTPLRVNSAARLGDKLYTMGGFDSPFPNLEVTKFYEYDINTNTWTEMPELPERVFFHRSFGSQDSLIYIVGGMQTATRDIPIKAVRIFNINQWQFEVAEPLPEPLAEFGLVKKMRKFYITGGITEGLQITNKTIEAVIDPSDYRNITYTQKADYPLNIRAQIGMRYFREDIDYYGGSSTLSLNPLLVSYRYNMEGNFYSPPSNAPYSSVAAHGYSIRVEFSFLREDFIVQTSVLAGGITGPPVSVTGQTWYRIDTMKVTDVNDDFDLIPGDFALHQNYPNPFNPSTSIEYRVGSTEYVTLKVFDVLGNEVAVLVNEEKPAGSYEVIFNAGNLSSGTYFYRLQAGEFSETKKFVLMK